ncbi:hypothetical protein Pla22_02070 [Rubripirellula amarantea]|uniref:Uncharacterized protein n=1 Tax=Rubripirellula amarantea TaxID=2527999 RepID=A0A5C5WRC0_9BACT|nr:hypothetical protein Pla22_02070 [Rubripirellula amarantea]
MCLGLVDSEASKQKALRFLRLNYGAALVIATFWAYRVRWHSTAALWAISDLTLFHVVVATAFASSAIGVFTFWDSHCLGSEGSGWEMIGFEPRILGSAKRFRQPHPGTKSQTSLVISAPPPCRD